ncbi:MAG: N-6 DNA methylase [Frankia sp.]|nr:N-6 DNA methylase [Frankia sp.]
MDDRTCKVAPVNADGQDEVTAAAIARRVGVGRAAVSNWRRRHEDFPKPIGGGANNPTYSWAEVKAWLKSTGRADQLAMFGRTETGTQAIGGPTRAADGRRDKPTEAEPPVTRLPSGALLARVIVSLLPPSTAAGNGGSAGAGNADIDTGDSETSDSNDDGYNDEGAFDLSGADLPAVLDPACAAGDLLLAVADRFGNQVRLLGQEIDESAVQSAALNLRGHPLAGPYEIRLGDSLRDDQFADLLGRLAAVVCETPLDQPAWPADELATDRRWEFGVPAPRDGELAWVQHCYAHLRPRGTAVVAVSPRTCVSPSGQSIREEMIRSGALRAVIALPPKMSSLPDTDVYLWVLRRPYGEADNGYVIMVDLSGVVDRADVPQQYSLWQRLFRDAEAALASSGRRRPGQADGGPGVSRAVPRLRLVDRGANLLPSRYVTTQVEATADDLAEVTDRLRALYARVGAGLPTFAAAGPRLPHAQVTIAELERTGALKIRSRDTTPRRGDVLVRTLGRPPVVATGTETSDSQIAHVIELNADRLDAHFVATFLRADARAVPVANTLGALSREDLRRCRIPRMSLPEQRRYGDEFRRLAELQDALSTLARLSATVIDQTVHGLTTGTLAPRRPTR